MKMRYTVLTLSVLLLLLPASAAELRAAVVDPATFPFVGNCEFAGIGAGAAQAGATLLDFRFLVTNEWNTPMTVRYEYYDYGTDAWIEGTTQACTIGANLPESNCIVSVPLKLGGKGNGTMRDAKLIRLKGVDPEGRMDALTKEFSFDIPHSSSDTENNAINKIEALRARMATLRSAGSCGPTSDEMQAANTALEGAEAALRSCDMRNAYNLPANAINALEKYTDSAIARCQAEQAARAAPEPEVTHTSGPETVAPEMPAPTQTPEAPPAPAATPQQQAGPCPMGFALPLLGFLAWSRMRRY